MDYIFQRRIHMIACLFLSLLPAPAGIAQTTVDGAFLHGGINRTYRLYIPAAYHSSVPVPLLFNLHGYGSNNLQQEFYADFRPVADTAGFIVAHPNGTPDFTNTLSWNTFNHTMVDDAGFLSALIDTIASHYSIDPQRIYSTGMSNGGFMSYDLACFLSTRIAAVASVTGSMIWPRLSTCNALHPLPVMQIHGTADATVPYQGNSLFAHIDTVVNYWVQHNNCLTEPQIIPVPDINTDDGCTAVRHIYTGGDAGTTVEFFKVLGGGHSWPGAPLNINITNMDFSATNEIWRFLSQYKLNELISGIRDVVEQTPAPVVSPNPASGKVIVRLNAQQKTQYSNIQVFNSTGHKIFSYVFPKGSQFPEWNVSKWSSGLYIIKLQGEHGNVSTIKMMVK